MNSPEHVNEGQSARWSVVLTDADGNPATPVQAFVSIYCRTTQTEIRAEAPISVTGPQLDVLVTSAENALVNAAANDIEVRRVIVRAPYGSQDAFFTTHDFTVRKLRT